MYHLSRTRTAFGRFLPWLAMLLFAMAWTGLEAADPPQGSGTIQAKTAAKGRGGMIRGKMTVAGESPQAAVDDVPATLDQALAKALENHPDIVAARAKLRLAEAELNRTRMEVARKTITLWNELQTHKELSERARHANATNPGTVSSQDLISLAASLAQSQAELRYMTGQVLPAASRGREPETADKPPQMPSGPIAEAVRTALNSSTSLEFSEERLANFVEYLKDFHHVEIQFDWNELDGEGIKQDKKISINLKGVPLSAAFQAMEDEYPPLRFVVRDYGILVTTRDRAQQEGFFPAIEFARQGGRDEAGDSNKPGEPQAPKRASARKKPEVPPKSASQPK